MSSVCSIVTASSASPSSSASFRQSRMKRMSFTKSVPLSTFWALSGLEYRSCSEAPEQSSPDPVGLLMVMMSMISG